MESKSGKAIGLSLLIIVCATLASVAIWFGAPLITMAGVAPFAGAVLRSVALLAVTVAAALALYFLAFKTTSRNEARDEAAPLRAKNAVANALEAMSLALRNTTENLRRLVGGRWFDRLYLYKAPWYLVIGPTGSGKTALVDSSELRFLENDNGKLRILGGPLSVAISDSAIFVETTGPFAEDTENWRMLGGLMKKVRPRTPANGLVIAMPAAEFAETRDRDRLSFDTQLRDRLERFQHAIGVRLPVYLVLTKIDEIDGFQSFFAGLKGQEGQVFGFTLPLPEEEELKAGGGGNFSETLDVGLQRLLAWQAPRLLALSQEPVTPADSLASLLFLPRLDRIRTSLIEFSENVFKSTSLSSGILLRGVYFVENRPALRSDGDRRAEDEAGAQLTRNRAYFVEQFFKQILLKEAGLTERDSRRILIDKVRTVSLGAVAAGVSLFVLSVGIVTYSKLVSNLAAVDASATQLLDEITKFQASREANREPNFHDILPLLDGFRTMENPELFTYTTGPFRFGGMLVEDNRLETEASRAYDIVLEVTLLPVLETWLSAHLRSTDITEQNRAQTLKIYLMMIGRVQRNPDEVMAWIRAFLNEHYRTTIQGALRLRLFEHFRHMVSSPTAVLTVDPQVVMDARNRLSQVPVAVWAYDLVKEKPEVQAQPSWRVMDVAGPLGPYGLVRRSGKLLSDPIAGMYRADVFYKAVVPAIYEVARSIAEQGWLFGNTTTTVPPDQVDALAQSMLDIYANDFVTVWGAFLNDLAIAPFSSLSTEVAVIQAFVGPPSPYGNALRAIAKETDLASAAQAARPEVGGTDDKAGAVATAVAEAKNRVESVTALAAARTPLPVSRTARTISDRFADLRRYTGGQQPPIDEAMKVLLQIASLIAPTASATGGQVPPSALMQNGAFTAAMDRLKVLAMTSPPFVAESWTYVINQTLLTSNVAGASDTDAAWQRNVVPFCSAAMDGKYPFVAATNETTISDFTRIFSPQGLIDQFFDKYLKALVDTSRSPWRVINTADSRLVLSPKALSFFEQVSQIRQAYFPDGSGTLNVPFDVTINDLDPGALRMTMEIDGQAISYQYGPVQSTPLKWPGPAGNFRIDFGAASAQSMAINYRGPWSFFRFWWSRNIIKPSPTRFVAPVSLGPRSFSFTLNAASINNPFRQDLLKGLKCPTTLLP